MFNTINQQSVQRDREILERLTNDNGDVDPQLVAQRGGINNIINNLSGPATELLIQYWGRLIEDIPNNLQQLQQQVNVQVPGRLVDGVMRRNFDERIQYNRILLFNIYDQIMQNPQETYVNRFLPGSIQLNDIWPELFQNMLAFVSIEQAEALREQDIYYVDTAQKKQEQQQAQQQDEINTMILEQPQSNQPTRIVTRSRGLRTNIINTAKFRKAIKDVQQEQRPGKRIPLTKYEAIFRSVFQERESRQKVTRLRRNRELEQMIIYTFPNRYIFTKSMYVTDDYYQRIANQGPHVFEGREDRLARDQFFQLNNQYMDRILNILRSQPDPNYNNPLDPRIQQNVPLKLGFQLAIQQALARMQQQPPNLNLVRDNVVQPFIDDIIDLILPYVRMRWNETNGQPASEFLSAYFFKTQNIATRQASIPNVQQVGLDFVQTWNNRILNGSTNFLQDLLLTYASHAGLPDPQILLNGDRFNVDYPVPNIASGLDIPENIDIDVYQRIQMIDDLIADLLGLTVAGRARFNQLHQSQAGDDINLLSLLRDIFDFVYQYMYVYWDNLNYHEYSDNVNLDGSHLANILCQLHFGGNFNKPGPYHVQSPEVKNWLRDLNIRDINLSDIIFQMWTYMFIIVLLHSTELSPVELRFAKTFFYPNQIEFSFQYNNEHGQQNIVQANFLPLQDMPFVIPRMIMRQLLYSIQQRDAIQLEGIQVPAMMYKRYYRLKDIYNQVAHPMYYTIRLDNLQTYFTFQLKTTSVLAQNQVGQPDNVPEIYPRIGSRANDHAVNPDYNIPQVEPQLYEDWPGLTQSMNAASNIITHFLPELRNLLENDAIAPLTQIQRNRILRIFHIQQNNQDDLPIPPLNSYAQLHMIFVVSGTNINALQEIGRVDPSLAQIARSHHPLNSATSRFRLKELDIKLTIGSRFVQQLDQSIASYTFHNHLAPDAIATQNLITEILTGLFIRQLYDMVSNNLGFQRDVHDDVEGSFYFNTLQLAEFDALYDYKLHSCTFVLVPRVNQLMFAHNRIQTLDQFQWNVEQESKRSAFLDPDNNPQDFQGPTRWINGAVFTLDNLPLEIKRLLPSPETSVLQRIYMERINLKYSCLTSYAAVFFFIFGIPDILIDEIGDLEVLLHKISIRGYYFFRELIIKYYRQPPNYDGPQLVLVLGNNDFLGHLLSIHFRNNDLCYMKPTHFECFKIQSFADTEQTAAYISQISLALYQHPAYKQTDLVNPQHPLNKRLIIPVYYHFDHVFILDEDNYSEYLKLCQLHKLSQDFTKKPIVTETVDMPLNKKRFINKPRGKQYMIVYDIETSSGLEEKMEPYLIYSVAFDLESELNKLRTIYQWLEHSSINDHEFDEVKEWWDNRGNFFQGDNLVDRFIESIMKSSQDLPDNSVVQVWAYNGSRFDHVILVPAIIAQWGDVKILGNPTNVKGLQIEIQRGIQIQLCDICLAVGGGSLDQNAQYFGIPGKLSETPPIDILQVSDWDRLSDEQKNIMLNYCRRDVFSATLLLIKFNDYCEDIAREMHLGKPQDILDPVRFQSSLYISNTLSQTAFKIVHKHIRDQPIYILDDLRIYNAMRDSYRGGICQLFTTQRIVCSQAEQIHYLDINSLYPTVMSRSLFGVKYTKIKFLRQYLTLQTTNEFALYAVCSFKLAPMFRYGFFPVKSPTTERIFYPMSWDIFHAARLYDQEPEYLWIWGFEIINMFKLNHATFLEKSVIKSDMFIPCDETNHEQSMFKDIEKLYLKRVQTDNPCLKQTLKRIMNMAYGKYGQRDHNINHYVTRDRFMNITQNNQSYIDQLCGQINQRFYPNRDLKVKSVNMVRGNSSIVQLQLIDKYEDIDHIPKLSKMVHIASQVTARAREHVWKIVYRIQSKLHSNRLLYMDTDSFIWSCDTLDAYQTILMHDFGQGLGQCKKVENALMWFQGLAPKMYAYQQFQTSNGPESQTIFKMKGFDQRQHDMEYVKELFQAIAISGTGTYTQIQWTRLPGYITRKEIKKEITVFNKRKMCNCYTRFIEHEEAYQNEREIFDAENDYLKMVRNNSIKDIQNKRIFQLTQQDIIEQEQTINEHITQFRLNDTVPGFQSAKEFLDINSINESRVRRFTDPQVLEEYKLIQKMMRYKLRSQFLIHRDCYAYNLLASRKPYIYKLIRLYLVVYQTSKSVEAEAIENWMMVIERIKYIETQANITALSGSHQYSLMQAVDFTVERLKQLDLILDQKSLDVLQTFSKNELNTTKPQFNMSFYNRW